MCIFIDKYMRKIKDIKEGIKLSYLLGFFTGILFCISFRSLWYGEFIIFIILILPVIISISYIMEYLYISK